MLSLSQIQNSKVFTTKPTKQTDELALKRLGKVHQLVFAPDGKQVVGFMVKRPDVVGMIKRDDVFLAFDSFAVCDEGLYCTNEKTGMGQPAIKRLGLDWEKCLIWAGMDVSTASGKNLGYIVDCDFNTATGVVQTFKVSNSGAANALIGTIHIPADCMQGYHNQPMIVSDDVPVQTFSGGFAAKAGQAVGAAQVAGAQAGKKIAQTADKALEKGSYSLGRALGKAKHAVIEATQLDPDVPELEAQGVKISASDPTKSAASESRTADKSDPQKSAAQDRSAVGSASAAAKKKSSSDDATAKAARAFGRNLSKTRGMFAAFKEEFDKNSK